MTAAALAAAVIPGLWSGLCVRHYELHSDKVSKPVRFALITDLHSCEYGDGQSELLELLDAQAPDAVLMSGDIIDDRRPTDNAEALLAAIGGRYPCYYVTGNHEYRGGEEAFRERMELLTEHGVNRLDDASVTVEINGEIVSICGVNDPSVCRLYSSYLGDSLGFRYEEEYVRRVNEVTGTADDDTFTVLLAHRPEYCEAYLECGCDLTVAGHAHGGQWRIPGIVNGIFAPGQGFFPKYAGGMYTDGDSAMIVSRGLSKSHMPIPRIYNRTELVVIDVLPER